ncbi:MAG: IS200/IS605 family transposase [Acidobacteria bacterium]|nr:IS200/IS605 family transposase [Acidobacteriota bacterium]
MAHTYTDLLFHVVFSTHGHLRSLTKERRAELFAYMAALIKEKGGRTLIINGVEDHVHLLIALPPTISLSDIMRFLKTNSSRWFSQRFNVKFAWQKGFGAFSVSRSAAHQVEKYIRHQEAHHQKRDFRQEFILMLEKSGVDFQEEFLWK